MQKSLSKPENRLITIWLVIGISVILGFFCFSAIIGGSALNGYIENGSFFVRSHSSVVEVSKTVFTISKVWNVLFYILLPLTPVGAFMISFVFRKTEQKANRTE